VIHRLLALVGVGLAAACQHTEPHRNHLALRARQDSMFKQCQQDEAQKHTAFRSVPGWTAERALAETERQAAYCSAIVLWATRDSEP